MNEFLAFDDADWELASAYLDNEATSAERAQVEASPALMELVADLRSMQSSVAAPAPAVLDRDAMISAAIAGAVEEPIIGRVAGSGDIGGSSPHPLGTAPVTSISAARSRRNGLGKTPMLFAAALVTVMGIGFALRSGSSKTSGKAVSVATSAAATTKAAQDQPTGNAAVPSAGATTESTEALAAFPAPAAAATTAAAAATTAAPAAPATTAAPAATTTAPASVTTGAPAATTVAPAAGGPPTTTAGPALAPLTLQELKDLVVANANTAALSALVCPDPRGVPRLSVQILWNGQPAIVYVDQVSQTLVILAVNGCTPVANIPIKDLAQS